MYPLQDAPAWQGSISREGPQLSGCRGHGPDRGAECQHDDDRNHDGSACPRLDGLVEDLDKRVACWSVERRVNVSEAEKQGNRHAKTHGAIQDDAKHDGLRHHGRGTLNLLGHVDGRIGAKEGKDVTQQADHERKSRRGPIAAVDKGREHLLGILVRA